MTKHSKLLSLAACIGTLFAVAPASALVTIDLPRTLDGYVEQDKAFWDYLKANHPYFKSYLKEGRVVGKFTMSDRQEEWVDFGGGKQYHSITQILVVKRLLLIAYRSNPSLTSRTTS